MAEDLGAELKQLMLKHQLVLWRVLLSQVLIGRKATKCLLPTSPPVLRLYASF